MKEKKENLRVELHVIIFSFLCLAINKKKKKLTSSLKIFKIKPYIILFF